MSTNTKTLLTIKTDKTLKKNAQKIAEEFGIPLGTLVNSMLRQMVRDREVNFALSYQPSKSTIKSIQEYEKDKASGNLQVSHSVEELMKQLHS